VNPVSYEIPLISQPQTLTVSLGGVEYVLHVYWSPQLGAWILDLFDSSSNDIATGIPMVTGVDLLGQLQYLGVGGALIVQSSGADALAPPTNTNLGQVAVLYFIPYSTTTTPSVAGVSA
jgi:hypothetical protein